MSREQTSYGGEGAVRGRGPLAGSGSWRDPEEESGLGLKSGESRQSDNDAHGAPPVTPRKAAEVYELFHTTELNRKRVAEEVGLSDHTVGRIAHREDRFGEMEELEGLAARLGYPDREER